MPHALPCSTLRSVPAAAAFVVLAMMARAAHADSPPIKPGLWEITTESRSVDGKALPDMSAQMAEQLKKMPPEMRKQMETHMKAQGVQMVPGKGGTGVRMCLTRDMLDQDRWQQSQGDCRNTGMNRAGNTWTWHFQCTQPPGEGEGKTTFEGSTAYATEMHLKTQHQGRMQTMTMKHRGKWLGADCGDIKPITPPAVPRTPKP
ncbi:MAG: DUF3617 domain-containing protein [Aquabacterium sp.]